LRNIVSHVSCPARAAAVEARSSVGLFIA